ncbi:MAG: M28 family peptidase [Spirosomaceae bacterium]|nr:M28 family peptidase [Spirosomataceae bacterium]
MNSRHRKGGPVGGAERLRALILPTVNGKLLTVNGLLLTAFCLLISTVAGAQDMSSQYAQSITPQDLERHLRVIAHDSLQGRDTGSPGQKKAADYVMNYFKSLGLQPIIPTSDGVKSYFQPYSLYQKAWGEVYLATDKQRYAWQQDFFLSGLVNVLSEEKIPVIFAGYGIESDKYDDYKGLDVKDKAVIVLEGEPKNANGQFLVSGDATASKWSNDATAWQRKVILARNKGAKYVLIVSDLKGDEFRQQVAKRSAMTQRFNRLSMRPYNENISGNAAFTISRQMALELLKIKEKALAKAEKSTLTTGKTCAGRFKERTLAIKAERKDDIVSTENVLGFLEGTDKKDEVVVITAHLDHIGISPNGEINNGADDDGSGTVSILELAEAFAKAKAAGHGPRRSILFMTVTGEEKGLFGSEYYTSNPVIPLKQTVCNLNIDMIGRIDEAHKNNAQYVYLIGSDKLSSELHAISEDANTRYINYQLDYTYNNPSDPNRFYYRSDHYNFAKNKVPVIFYFTGVHEDYHRPGDDVEKIMFDKQAKIVQLVFHTAWELTNREQRIKVDSNKP